jgi:electron transfer flavoprotein beta subunit
MAANRTQIPMLSDEDLTDIDRSRIGLKGSPTHVKKSFVPVKERNGMIIQEETLEESSAKLISILSDTHVI